MENVHDFLAGCIGGCAGVFVGHPFDTVKVRLQLQCTKNPLYKGTFDCLTQIIKKESTFGLYKGVTSPLYSLAAINAIVFGVQGNVIRRMENPEALTSHFLAGAAAGFVQSFICGPMELAKTRMQMQGLGESRGSSRPHMGTFDCLKKIYKYGGAKGISRGMYSTIVREVPAFGTYFVTYAWLTRQLTPEGEENCPTFGLLLAGGLAGCSAWIVTYPVDVIKSRMQADGVITQGRIVYQYSSYKECLTRSLSQEGYRVLSRGLNSTLLRAFPTNAATFTVYEWCMRYLRPSSSRRTSEYESISSVATLD